MSAPNPAGWVVKGGMAMEVRLRDDARLTKDIDLGLRDAVTAPDELHERVVDALGTDLDADGFVFAAAEPEPLATDGDGTPTWRIKVGVQLAGKQFDTVQLDVSPRQHELAAADRIELPNLLAFAGVPAPIVEVVDVHRHAAEKFHAMLRDYGDRENSRVRDLVARPASRGPPTPTMLGIDRDHVRRRRRSPCGGRSARRAMRLFAVDQPDCWAR